LVGICKTGREVHEHIDEGLFKRLGFPAWMVTSTVEEYIAAAVRLVDHPAERLLLRRAHSGPHCSEVLFKGRADVFGERLLALLRQASGTHDMSISSAQHDPLKLTLKDDA